MEDWCFLKFVRFERVYLTSKPCKQYFFRYHFSKSSVLLNQALYDVFFYSGVAVAVKAKGTLGKCVFGLEIFQIVGTEINVPITKHNGPRQ
jgi:hypothetical protein